MRLECITRSILVLRGQRVILDRELAAIYGVSAKRLNEQVKRHAKRFPEDFMFQLTAEEAQFSRSKIATSKNGRHQNTQHLPHAFTEHGAIQASNALNSPRAVTMGIYVVRAFTHLRQPVNTNRELAPRFARLERRHKRLTERDRTTGATLPPIRALMHSKTAAPRRRPAGYITDIDEMP